MARAMAMFMVLSSWHCHFKSSPNLSNKCITALGSCQPLDPSNQLEPQICLIQQLQYYSLFSATI